MKNQSGNEKCIKSFLKTKIAMLLLCLVMCLSLALGITLASPTATASAEEGTTITQLTVSGLTEADLPKIGPLSDLSGITLNDGLTVNTAYWIAMNMWDAPQPTSFEYGHTYALRLQYSAPEGKTVSLTDPSKVTLAGIDPSKYTVQLNVGPSFINFVFDTLGDEELSLVNPERMNVPDGFVGEYITTGAIYVKGGKYPYKFSDMHHPEWLKYAVSYESDTTYQYKIYFSGYRPTVPAPAESFGFKVTDAEGNTQTFTGTTGATVENPDGIANIVLKYDLPAVGEEKPTTAELKSAITLPEGVEFEDGDSVWFWKDGDITGGTLTQFERWETYNLSAELKTTDGKTFAGLAMLKGTIISTPQYSVTASFGNKTDTTLTVQFTIKMYGVSLEEQENYKITTESLKKGKVGVPYSDKIAFGKPADVEDADIEIKSNSSYVKYGGLSLSADGTFAGTPDSRVYNNWGDTVDITFEYYCKGYLLDSKTLTLTVEGYTQIWYDYGKTLYYNGKEQTAYEDAEGYTVTGNKATDVGTYTATFKLNPGYAWGSGASYGFSDWTATWKIEKGNREAPTGLSAVSTSGVGASDGKITGVTEEMEYATEWSFFMPITGTEITGLAAGTYEVRYAETDNWNASSSTFVTVTDGGIVTYTLNVEGGSGSGVFEAGKSVTITANAPDTGKQFTGWTLTGVTVEDTSLTELTFEMPANNVTATANYDFIDYTVSITGGTADKTTAHYGETVTITANAPETGKQFTGWTLTGVTVGDKTKAEITFEMPANSVTATAEFDYIDYRVTVEGGTADKTTAHYGDSVTITADEPEKGKEFDKWTVTGLDTAGLDLTKPELTFTMPAGDVKATANYKDIQKFYVSVTGGTGGGEYYVGATVTVAANPLGGAAFVKWTVTGIDTAGLDLTKKELSFTMPANDVTVKATYSEMEYSVTVIGGTADKAKAKYGDTVTVTANAPAGKRFARWTSEGGVSFDNLTSENTTFKMPANSVTITAVFEDINYTVTVTDGTADKTTAHYGDTVKITADTAPVGQTFDRWEITGIDTASLDLTQAELTFTVGTADIAAKATYKYIDYTVTVVGGTCNNGGENAESITAEYGDCINIVAEVPTGKRFVRWTSDSAEVVFDSETSDFTSFEMPASDVTVTAVFEDIDYMVTVTGGTADKSTVHYGDTVSITAGEAPEGKVFDKWTCETDGITIEFASATSASTTFIMPAGDISVKANYRNVEEAPSFEIKVNGGTGGGIIAEGASVTITADEITGREFVRWEITGLDTSGLVLTNAELTFTMPASDVTATALYSYIDYKATVVGGTAQVDADAEPTSEVFATYECPVSIFATAPAGKRFVRWTSADGVVFEDETSAETSFTMPAKNVTVTAVFEYIDYTVTVNGGTADKTTAHYGDTVSITAGEAAEGKVFDKWTCETDGITIEFASATSAETTFTMPAGDISVKANYRNVEEAPSFEIKVNGGTGAGTYKEGDSVTVTAAEPEEGKIFTGWKDADGNIVSTDKSYTFTVSKNISLTAVYGDIEYTVTINGGTGGGVYKEGDSVTVTAAEPEEGKIFKGWQDADGNIVSTDKSYTFTVSGEVSLTAVYEDKPDGGETGGNITPAPEKKGLGGGAIAGIVIASVAVVGMGGFAIFWFVIKKKSFADLIAAIKKPFTKK